jgi:hypothetical protein
VRRVPRRFWKPLGIAWAATVVAVVLATIQRGEYSPNLAVLTLTLIAVVWYTYFTYRSVHREPPAYLLPQLDYEAAFESLYPILRNPTERTLEVRINLDIWVDGARVEMDAFYSGRESKKVAPTQGFRGAINLRPHTNIKRDQYNAPVSGANEVLVRMTVEWNDDLGDSGSTLPIYLRIAPQAGQHHDLVAPSEIERHFRQLPGF